MNSAAPIRFRECSVNSVLLGALAMAPVAGCSSDPVTDTGTGHRDGFAAIDVDRTDGAMQITDATVDAASACTAANTCSECAALAGCGWCSSSDRCLPGDASGSANGTCGGPSWDFTGDLCAVPTDAGPTTDTGRADSATRCVPSVARGAENTNALCANGIDDDCNGYADCSDFNCSRNPSVTVCRDGGLPPPHDGGAPDSGAPFDAGRPGAIGPTGGTVGLMHFAVFGDCRPPAINDTAGYPSVIVDAVMRNLAELHMQFAAASGDYMFATSRSAVDAQIALLLASEARFGGYVFHGMGNHECTGGTSSNCPNGDETPNVQAYMSRLNVGHTAPYFDWTIRTSMGNAHFISTAPNAWSSAQQTWLTNALATSATYTFVLAHEPPSGTQGPGSSAIEGLVRTRMGGVTMRLYGHTHEYRHVATNAVIDGNAGAPLQGTGGTGDYYGFATIDQRADGNIVFNAYQIGSPPMVSDSFVVTPAGAPTR